MTSDTGFFPALQQALLLLAMATAIGLGLHATKNGPLLTAPIAPATSNKVHTLTIAEAKALQASGTAFFLDVRDSMDYMDSHLQGAGNLPLNQDRQQGKPITIIVYCSGPSCGKATSMANRMQKNGLNVAVLPDGAGGWASAGNAMEMSQ